MSRTKIKPRTRSSKKSTHAKAKRTKKSEAAKPPAFSLKGLIRPGRRGIRTKEISWSRFFLCGALASAIFLGGSGAILWSNGWLPRQIGLRLEQVYSLTADSGLAVVDVLVEGRHRNSPTAVLTKLDVERGSPILEFSPQRAKSRLEELPWVKGATVERRLPNMIYVRLEEKKPLALWQSNGELHVVDQAGEVIAGAEPFAFSKLPVIVGPDAPRYAREIIALINSEPDLHPMIKAAVRISERRWNLRLKNNINIKLPEKAPRKAWQTFAKMERESAILNRDIVAIDLRLPDRIIVRTSDNVKPGKRRPEPMPKPRGA